MFGILADVIVVLHLAFVAFVVLGGLLVLRSTPPRKVRAAGTPGWPRVAWLHIPAAVWGALIEFAGWICPLTPLENWLRERGGGSAYESSFVERYIVPTLYPEALSRELQWLLGGLVILINTVVYATVLRRRRARQD